MHLYFAVNVQFLGGKKYIFASNLSLSVAHFQNDGKHLGLRGMCMLGKTTSLVTYPLDALAAI